MINKNVYPKKGKTEKGFVFNVSHKRVNCKVWKIIELLQYNHEFT